MKLFRVDDEVSERPAPVRDFVWHTSRRIAQEAGSTQLQIDVRSLDPDRFSFPYHFHRASEEFFVVLEGVATLRHAGGFRSLVAGDLAFFPKGPEGAHQLYNHADAPCRYLDVRTTPELDVVEYPDSGKVMVLPLGKDVYRVADQVDYYAGEEAVRSHWPNEILRRRSS